MMACFVLSLLLRFIVIWIEIVVIVMMHYLDCYYCYSLFMALSYCSHDHYYHHYCNSIIISHPLLPHSASPSSC